MVQVEFSLYNVMKKIVYLFLLLMLALAYPSVSMASPTGMETATDQDGNNSISGIVTDQNGEPLAGVTVLQRGTQNKTITDLEGRYTIRLKAGSGRTLVFTYIGMVSQTIPVKGSVARVMMKEDATALQDVVVIGAYGTAQKRSDLVGSAYQVNADQLKGLPQQRLDVMLDGLIPGVKIDPNTADPGSPRTRYEVRVRGEASLNASNEPLWVVDGTPMYTGDRTNLMPGTSYTVSPLSFLNPEDIASVTVLKDATAHLYLRCRRSQRRNPRHHQEGPSGQDAHHRQHPVWYRPYRREHSPQGAWRQGVALAGSRSLRQLGQGHAHLPLPGQ